MTCLIALISIALATERGLEKNEVPFFDHALIGEWQEAHTVIVSKGQLHQYGLKTPVTPVRLSFTKYGQLLVFGEKGRRLQLRCQTMLIGRKTCLRVFERESDKAARWLYTIQNGYLYMAVDEDSPSADKLLRKVPMSLGAILEEDSRIFIISKYRRVSPPKEFSQ